MFDHLATLLIPFATLVPLPVSIAFSSFLEEIIAPIPSGAVMLVMGSLASVQGYALSGLATLVVLAAIGKVFGALVVYVVADKAEDLIMGRFARYTGISHAQIEAFGARLGNGWKDYAVLTFFRSLPFVPSLVISAGSGILKIPVRLFVFATFFGSLVRDAIFLYLGYAGLPYAENLIGHFSTVESLLQLAIVVAVLVVIGVYGYKRQRR